MWEQDPMIKLTKKKELSAYYHKGFLALYGYRERL